VWHSVYMASGELGIRGRGSCRDESQANTHAGTNPAAATNAEAGAAAPAVRGAERTDDAEHVAYGSDGRLSDAMLSVGRFHQAFNLPRASRPGTGVPDALAQLRVDLLVEEVREFADATAQRDLVGIADALADIVYVAYGAAVTYGINLDAALHEVHRSNMSKLDESGRPVYREDGKVLKSARYTPPDIPAVLSAQPPLPF
jgi:predicted HAD superfamily Cof-like phosphohydrolase